MKSGVNEPTCLKKESNRLTNSLECVYYRKDFGDIKAYSNKNIFNKASISTTDSFDINLIDDKKIKNAKIVSPFYKTITSTNSSADINFRIPIDFGLDSDKEYIVANKITNIKGETHYYSSNYPLFDKNTIILSHYSFESYKSIVHVLLEVDKSDN